MKFCTDIPFFSLQVEYIEQASMMTTQGYVTQSNAPYGPARISHRQRGSTEYTYDDSAGAGTCTYIIDSGIDAQHPVNFLFSPMKPFR